MKIIQWYKKQQFKLHAYVFSTTCVMLLPYISIQWYKYKGESSIGCTKLNIQMGFIYCAVQLTSEHSAPSKNQPLKNFAPLLFILFLFGCGPGDTEKRISNLRELRAKKDSTHLHVLILQDSLLKMELQQKLRK